jgi:hypothetical protein
LGGVKIMIHKISELCQKIDGIKKVSDNLYNIKYNQPKTPERDAEVNALIEDIQLQCKLVANDKGEYDR